MTSPGLQIALVIDRFDPRRGGAEAYLDRLARELVRRDHRVTLVTGDCGDLPGEEEVSGYRVQTLDFRGRSRLEREKNWADAVRAHCGKGPYDEVIGIRHTSAVTVYNPHGGIFQDALWRSSFSSASMAVGWAKVGIRRLDPVVRYYLNVEREILQSPGIRIVAVSDFVGRRLREVYGVPETRIRVISNGVDLERFRPPDSREEKDRLKKEFLAARGIDANRFVVLFVGHNFRLKGLGRAVEVVDRLSRGGVPAILVVCGRGGKKREVARIRRSTSEVLFVGETPRPEDLYAVADVFLHPTYYDPCSLVVLEAMACGVPVVTTAWNGASEALREVVGSRIVPSPGAVREMAQSVADLASDAGFWIRASEAVRKAVEAHPWAEKLAAMERVLLEGKSRG